MYFLTVSRWIPNSLAHSVESMEMVLEETVWSDKSRRVTLQGSTT